MQMEDFEIIQKCLNRVQEEIVAELNATTIDAIKEILIARPEKNCGYRPQGKAQKGEGKMAESQRKWDKEHMKTVSCRLNRKTAEDFAAKAADEGKTPYAVLKEFIYQYLYGKER